MSLPVWLSSPMLLEHGGLCLGSLCRGGGSLSGTTLSPGCLCSGGGVSVWGFYVGEGLCNRESLVHLMMASGAAVVRILLEYILVYFSKYTANSSFNLSWQLTSLFWPWSNTRLHSTKLSLHFLCACVRLGTSPLIEYLIKASCRRDLRRIQVPNAIHHIFLALYFPLRN